MPRPVPDISKNPDGLRTEVLSAETALATLMGEWQALFDAIGTARWCCAPQVYAEWVRTLRPGLETPVIVVRDTSGRLRAVMALMHDLAWRGPQITPRFDYDPQDRGALESRRPRPVPVRQISTPASLPATMLWTGPLCAQEDYVPVMQAVGLALRDILHWDTAVFATSQANADDLAWALAPAGRVRVQRLDRMAMSISRLTRFDDILSRQSGKYRQNIRRARRFGDKNGLEIDVMEGRDEVRRHFGLVEDLAVKSWKHEGRPGTEVSIPYDKRQRLFFEALMGSDTLGGTPALVVARDPDGPVAVLTLLALGRSVSSLLTFWDGRLPKASPGLQIMGRGIDWALERGAACYDLNATAEWVRPLADTFTPICNVVVFRRTIRGHTFAALNSAMTRLRP